MKRFVLVSLFLLAAVLTSVAQVQAPGEPLVGGIDLYRLLQDANHSDVSKWNQTDLIKGFYMQGEIYGVFYALNTAGAICLPPRFVSIAEIDLVVENSMREHPQLLSQRDAAKVITGVLLTTYPCKQPDKF